MNLGITNLDGLKSIYKTDPKKNRENLSPLVMGSYFFQM